jgi:hypothetical protein
VQELVALAGLDNVDRMGAQSSEADTEVALNTREEHMREWLTDVSASVFLCFAILCWISSVDPFTRKDWYDIKAPSMFEVRNVGKTLVNRTQGLSKYTAQENLSAFIETHRRCIPFLENATDGLKGRVIELSLADLNKDEDQAFRKVKLRIDEIQGKSCLTNFYGMDFTSDKLRSLVKKWQVCLDLRVALCDALLLWSLTFALCSP